MIVYQLQYCKDGWNGNVKCINYVKKDTTSYYRSKLTAACNSWRISYENEPCLNTYFINLKMQKHLKAGWCITTFLLHLGDSGAKREKLRQITGRDKNAWGKKQIRRPKVLPGATRNKSSLLCSLKYFPFPLLSDGRKTFTTTKSCSRVLITSFALCFLISHKVPS